MKGLRVFLALLCACPNAEGSVRALSSALPGAPRSAVVARPSSAAGRSALRLLGPLALGPSAGRLAGAAWKPVLPAAVHPEGERSWQPLGKALAARAAAEPARKNFALPVMVAMVPEFETFRTGGDNAPDSQAAGRAAPRRAQLGSLAASRVPESSGVLHFDGGGSVASRRGTVSARGGLRRSPALKSAALESSSAAPAAREDAPAAPVEKLPARRFKTGALAGVIAAATVPALYAATPPLEAAHAATLALAALGSAWALVKLVRLARSLAGFVLGRRSARPRRKLGGLAGFVLGAALTASPLIFPETVIQGEVNALEKIGAAWAEMRGPGREDGAFDRAIALISSHKGARSAGDALDAETLRVLGDNAEGRAILDGLRDRGGKVRLPAFFIAGIDENAAGRYVSVFDAVFINENMLRGRNWSVEEFLGDPDKRRIFLAEHAALFAHELRHAAQMRRRLFLPGQFEDFPRKLGTILALETEYEAHISEQLFVHEELKKGGGELLNLGEYEGFLDDLDGFLAEIDESPTYAEFRRIDTRYYREFLAGFRARWPALSVEGYLLLARRHPADSPRAAELQRKAAARAAEYGLPAPGSGKPVS